MDIALPLAPLLAAITVLVAINFASLALLARGRAVTNAELTAALLFDVAALAWQLHHSGGLTNPFASLFLLQVVIGAILLTPRRSEEHTSELRSLMRISYAVFCLKKKNNM